MSPSPAASSFGRASSSPGSASASAHLTAVKKVINRVRFGGEDAEQFIAVVQDTEVPFSELLEDASSLFFVREIRHLDGRVLFASSSLTRLKSGSPTTGGVMLTKSSPSPPVVPCDALARLRHAAPEPLETEQNAVPELPDALWVLIMRHLATRDVCMLARVSRGLRRAAASPTVWRTVHANLFGCALAAGAGGADAAQALRRACRRSELRAARWLEATPTALPLGFAAVCVAVDAAKVACGERDCVRVYGTPGAADAADAGRKLGTLRGHTADVTCVATSDAALLSGDAGGTLRLWGTDDFKLRRALRGHAGAVSACLLLPSGTPVSAGADGTVRIWDAAAPAAVAVLECDTAVTALAADASAPGCPAHLYAGGGFIDCIDLASATRTLTLVDVLDEPGEPGLVPVTRLAAHGPLLAAGGAAGGVSLWDVRAGGRVVACLPLGAGGACGGLQLDEWKLVSAFGGEDAVFVHDIRTALGSSSCAVVARAPLMRLPVEGRVTALGFCGAVLLAAVEGRPCVAWSFDAPQQAASAAGLTQQLAAATSWPDAPDTPGNADAAGRAERRKKGVVPKVRGRFPKRSTR